MNCPTCTFRMQETTTMYVCPNCDETVRLIKEPTLKGRLNQPLTTRLEALEQLKKTMPLSELGEKVLKRERSKLRRNK